MFGRRKVAALLAEFLGTGVLTLIFLSVLRSSIGAPYFVGLGAGLVLAMVMFIFGDASGAHTNPAITIALWTARKVGTLTALLYVVVQLLGAWAAYGLYRYFVNAPVQAIGGHYTTRVLVVEAIGTLILALGWGAVAFRNYTAGSRAAAVGISYALGIIVAGATATSFGVINPAVAEGIRAWDVFGSMGWAYVAGPVLGAVIGINLYGLLFATSTVASESVVIEEVVVAEAVEVPATTSRRRSTTKSATTRRASATRGRAASTTSRTTRGAGRPAGSRSTTARRATTTTRGRGRAA